MPDIESDLASKEYLCGKTICIDSINDSILEQTQSILSSIIKEYTDVSILSINPSPLLQDYIVQQLQSPDSILLTTYCERVDTVYFYFSSFIHRHFNSNQRQNNVLLFLVVFVSYYLYVLLKVNKYYYSSSLSFLLETTRIVISKELFKCFS